MSLKKFVATAVTASVALFAGAASAQILPNDVISIQTEGCLRAPLAPSPANAVRLRITDVDSERSYVWSFWYEPCVQNAPGTVAYPYDSFLVFSVRPEQAFALDRDQIERVELLVSQNGLNPERTVRQFAFTTYEPLSFEYTGIVHKGYIGFFDSNKVTSILLDNSFTAALVVPKRIGAAPRVLATSQTGSVNNLGLNGMWLNESESGWGVSVSQSPATNQLFVTWYTYDNEGEQQFLTMPGGKWTAPDVFGGMVYKTKYAGKGSFSGKFDATKTKVEAVGRGSISFTPDGVAQLNYIGNDGVNRSSKITRMAF